MPYGRGAYGRGVFGVTSTTIATGNEGTATLSGVATLLVIGAVTQGFASATLAGTGTLAAVPSYQGVADLTGTATLAAVGESAFSATAALSGAGTVVTVGSVYFFGLSSLTAAGAVAAGGSAVTTNTVTNAGARATPRFTVTVDGAAASPIVLQSLTEGKTLTIAQTVPSGQSLVVDFLTHRITLNGVAVGGATGQWWELRSGANLIHANRPASVSHYAAYV